MKRFLVDFRIRYKFVVVCISVITRKFNDKNELIIEFLIRKPRPFQLIIMNLAKLNWKCMTYSNLLG